MRFNIDIPDDLLRRLSKLAEREQTTVEHLTTQGLWRIVAERANGAVAEPVTIRPVVVQGEGLTPEAQRLTWRQIMDEANERPHDWC